MNLDGSPTLTLTAWQVIRAMQDAVMIVDRRGAIMAVNDAFCAVTGFERSEVLGRNPRLLQSGRHRRAFYAALWSCLLRTGRWEGEIWNRRKNGEIYPEWLKISAIENERGQARCYLGVFRDITSPKRREERLRLLAQYDPLTGLPNRRLFQDKLRHELAHRPSDRRRAVLFLDLDHFKDVNDRWGHAAGDAFLQAVCARLRGCVRRTDTVARWAGDEFAVLLDPVAGRTAAARAARKILRILRRPFTVQGRRATTSASIGGCMLDGGPSPERLMAKADRAMYAVKKSGRDDIRFWTRAISLRRNTDRTRRPP